MPGGRENVCKGCRAADQRKRYWNSKKKTETAEEGEEPAEKKESRKQPEASGAGDDIRLAGTEETLDDIHGRVFVWDKMLLIDFKDYPALFEDLQRIAKREFRTPKMQVIKIIATYLEDEDGDQ